MFSRVLLVAALTGFASVSLACPKLAGAYVCDGEMLTVSENVVMGVTTFIMQIGPTDRIGKHSIHTADGEWRKNLPKAGDPENSYRDYANMCDANQLRSESRLVQLDSAGKIVHTSAKVVLVFKQGRDLVIESVPFENGSQSGEKLQSLCKPAR